MKNIKIYFIIIFISNIHILFSQKKNYSDEDYQSVIEISTQKLNEDSIANIEYLKSRAEAFFAINESKKALRDLNSYLKTNSKDSYAYFNRGIVKKKLGDLKGATNDFSYALKYSPTSSDIHFARGAVYHDLKNYSKAIIDYKNAIKFNNKNEEALNNLALILIEKHDYGLAIEYLNTVLSLNSNRLNSLYNRAFAFIKSKEWSKAKTDLENALKISPNNPYANNYMGYLLYLQGKKQNACKYFKVTLESNVAPIIENLKFCE